MHLLPTAIIIPILAGIFLALVNDRARRLIDIFALVSAAALFAVSFFLFRGEAQTYALGSASAMLGIPLVLDGFSQLMLLLTGGVLLTVVLYCPAFLDSYTGRGRFYGLIFLMLAGVNAAVLAGDLFTLFIFLEVASIASYILAGYGNGRLELTASFTYLVYGTIAGLLILLGTAVLYAHTGSTNLAKMAEFLSSNPAAPLSVLALSFLIAGLALKAGIAPFHAWVPPIHTTAPEPVSALIAALFGGIVGTYGIGRIAYSIYGFEPGSGLSVAIIMIGVLSMFAGTLAALAQKNAHRNLAFGTAAEVGFIIIALGLSTDLGLAAAIFHLITFIASRTMLFLDHGRTRLTGNSRVANVTRFIAILTAGGAPPFAGFFSKLVIIYACIEAGRNALAIVAVIMAIITWDYLTSLLRSISKETEPARKSGGIMLALPSILLAAVCVVGGGLWVPNLRQIFIERSLTAAKRVRYINQVLPGRTEEDEIVIPPEILEGIK